MPSRMALNLVNGAISAVATDIVVRSVTEEDEHSPVPALVAGLIGAIVSSAINAVEDDVQRVYLEAIDTVLADEVQYKMWVAERDGCVHCLERAGDVVVVDGAFTNTSIYSDAPMNESAFGGDELDRPPYHPHCRCVLVPYDPAFDATRRGYSAPESLKREAQRSLASGWSLENESHALRVRAAERVLRQDPDLPEYVILRARAAVRRGGFISRSVPTTR